MPDIADEAQLIEDEHRLRGILAARAAIPAGVAGECEECFEDMPRLVDGLCARCRDGRTRAAPIVRRAEVAAGRAEAMAATIAPGLRRLGAEARAALEQVAVAATAAANRVRNRESEMGERTRQINFTAKGEVLDAIEAAAEAGGGVIGHAALALVEAGLRAETTPASVATGALTPRQRMAALLMGLEGLLVEMIEAAEQAGDTGALTAERDAAIVRAEAAEARVAKMKAVLS